MQNLVSKWLFATNLLGAMRLRAGATEHCGVPNLSGGDRLSRRFRRRRTARRTIH